MSVFFMLLSCAGSLIQSFKSINLVQPYIYIFFFCACVRTCVRVCAFPIAFTLFMYSEMCGTEGWL